MHRLDRTTKHSEEVEEVDSDNDDDTPMTVQTYKQAIQSLEDVHVWSMGHTHEAMEIGTSVYRRSRVITIGIHEQTTLTDYFQHASRVNLGTQ